MNNAFLWYSQQSDQYNCRRHYYYPPISQHGQNYTGKDSTSSVSQAPVCVVCMCVHVHVFFVCIHVMAPYGWLVCVGGEAVCVCVSTLCVYNAGFVCVFVCVCVCVCMCVLGVLGCVAWCACVCWVCVHMGMLACFVCVFTVGHLLQM